MDNSPLTRLLAALGAAARGAPPVLVVRHADRESLRAPTMDAANEAPLTEVGRQRARQLGARLHTARPLRLLHSPVPRCQETAELIAAGVCQGGGRAQVAGPRDALGAPFLRDPERAIDQLSALGMAGFVRAWLAGQLPPGIAEPHPAAARALLDGLLAERGADPAALHVNVTHDLTIVTLLGLCFPVDAPGFPWPGFLDGCVLEDGSPPRCHYHGEARPLPG